nr:uncharacterized protein LOC109173367 [Ipomoea trifida]
MASQNPFTTFSTSKDRLILARKIVQGISDFNQTDCAKIALTFALNPSLMDDLTVKESRLILELAKQCSEVPWRLTETAQQTAAPQSTAVILSAPLAAAVPNTTASPQFRPLKPRRTMLWTSPGRLSFRCCHKPPQLLRRHKNPPHCRTSAK